MRSIRGMRIAPLEIADSMVERCDYEKRKTRMMLDEMTLNGDKSFCNDEESSRYSG
jgi:hypothetical protein